jgi:hypothetical protein
MLFPAIDPVGALSSVGFSFAPPDFAAETLEGKFITPLVGVPTRAATAAFVFCCDL